uniref:Uncharacterized protein n=1 Tax=Anguilla anguilla TaxID=7936 RepID=A0A0E9WH94_ANGAN
MRKSPHPTPPTKKIIKIHAILKCYPPKIG